MEWMLTGFLAGGLVSFLGSLVMDGTGIVLYLGGIALGTLLALELFAFSGRYLSRRFSPSGGLVNRAVGLMMVATALLQIVHLFL